MRTLRLTLEGALLVGGHSTATGYLDASTAVDEDGRPFVTASALKGALRECVTRLLRGQGAPACTILEVDARCTGEARCAVCRIFGAPGTEPEELLEKGAPANVGTPGRVSFGAARVCALGGLEGDAARGASKSAVEVRHGVSIDRKTRSAFPELLFRRGVFDAPGAVLEARIDGALSDEDWRLLEAGARLLSGIGNGRSRGLGAVRAELAASDAAGVRHEWPNSAPADGVALVELEALEPLVLGDLPPTSNVIDSLDFVAGSTLRGAFGTAAAGLGVDARFRRVFVDPDTCLLFSDA